MKILEDAFAIQDAGCFMLEFEAVPAKIATVISQAARDPHHRHRRRRRHRRADPALPRPARRLHRLQAQVHQALRQPDRGRGQGHHAVHHGGEGRHLPRRRPQLRRRRKGVREVRGTRREAKAPVAPAASAERGAYARPRGDDRHSQARARRRRLRGRALERARASAARPSARPCSASRAKRLVTILPRRGIVVSEINVDEAAAPARGAPRARDA